MKILVVSLFLIILNKSSISDYLQVFLYLLDKYLRVGLVGCYVNILGTHGYHKMINYFLE